MKLYEVEWNRRCIFILQTFFPLRVPSGGSVDNKFPICAAEASKPSQSSGPSSESSPTSNPIFVVILIKFRSPQVPVIYLIQYKEKNGIKNY